MARKRPCERVVCALRAEEAKAARSAERCVLRRQRHGRRNEEHGTLLALTERWLAVGAQLGELDGKRSQLEAIHARKRVTKAAPPGLADAAPLPSPVVPRSLAPLPRPRYPVRAMSSVVLADPKTSLVALRLPRLRTGRAWP